MESNRAGCIKSLGALEKKVQEDIDNRTDAYRSANTSREEVCVEASQRTNDLVWDGLAFMNYLHFV